MAGSESPEAVADDEELPEDTWSVAAVNEEIQHVLADANDRFPTYVVGEVSEVSAYGFGTFFTLRDLEAEAVISCIAWEHAVDSFEYDLEEGAKAIVRASVDFYPEKGRCQLVVKDYWPLGESARQQAYEELKATLESEGLLASERKQSLPAFPDCIGVVTSLSGSAREDVCSAIHERAPGVDVKLHGATMQGQNAVPTLVSALVALDADPEVDVLVLTRGGGADADLWAFNEEPLVRAVADCSTPVVAAIGHEDDRTLTELVADVRAMTPTDAGVRTAPDIQGILSDLAAVERRIDGAYRTHVDDELGERGRRIAQAHDALGRAAASQRDAHRQRAADLEQRVDAAYTTLVESRLDGMESRLDTALREQQADARVEAGTAQARKLKVVVAVLVAVLVLGAVAVAILLL